MTPAVDPICIDQHRSMRVASGHGVSEVYGSGGVGVGGDLGGGLFAELDVPAEAGQVLVAGFGLELGGGAAVDGKVQAAECRSWWSVQPFLCGSRAAVAGLNRYSMCGTPAWVTGRAPHTQPVVDS